MYHQILPTKDIVLHKTTFIPVFPLVTVLIQTVHYTTDGVMASDNEIYTLDDQTFYKSQEGTKHLDVFFFGNLTLLARVQFRVLYTNSVLVLRMTCIGGSYNYTCSENPQAVQIIMGKSNSVRDRKNYSYRQARVTLITKYSTFD